MHEHQAHLSAEQLLELVERGRRCRRYDEYIDHIVECPICRETYKQLLAAEFAVRAARKSQRAHGVRVLVPAAAAGLILFFGARLLLSGSNPSGALRQVNGAWYEGATRLPAWAFTAAAQFSNPPAVLTRDTRNGTPPFIRLTDPHYADASLETQRTEFRWAPVPGAVRYRAWLERPGTDESIPLQVETNRALLPQGITLQAGTSYRLMLEALRAGEVAGEGVKSVYEFRTLTSTEQAQLRWARANRQNAPRTCTVIFYQLGFYDDALQTLNTLPDEPLVKRWRTMIEAQMKKPSS